MIMKFYKEKNGETKIAEEKKSTTVALELNQWSSLVQLIKSLQEYSSETVAIKPHILCIHEGLSDKLESILVESKWVSEDLVIQGVLLREAAFVHTYAVVLVSQAHLFCWVAKINPAYPI